MPCAGSTHEECRRSAADYVDRRRSAARGGAPMVNRTGDSRQCTFCGRPQKVQENAFKEADALGLSEHRGNSSRIVANVAVVSELERLESRVRRDADVLKELVNETAALESAVDEHTRERQRAESALVTRRRRRPSRTAGPPARSSRGSRSITNKRSSAPRPPRSSRPSRAQCLRSIAPAAPRSSSAPMRSPRADDISNHSA